MDDPKGDQSALNDERCEVLVLGQQNARLRASTRQKLQIARTPFVTVQDLDVMAQCAKLTNDRKRKVLICQEERQAGRPLLGGAARRVDLLDRERDRSLNVLERERRVRLDDLRGSIAGREFLEDLRHADPSARDPGLAGQGVGRGDDCGAHYAFIARMPATRQPCGNGLPRPHDDRLHFGQLGGLRSRAIPATVNDETQLRRRVPQVARRSSNGGGQAPPVYSRVQQAGRRACRHPRRCTPAVHGAI